MVETRTGTVVVRSRMSAPQANGASFGVGIGRAMQQMGGVGHNVALKYIDEEDKLAQKDAVNRGMEWENQYEKLRREKVNTDILARKGKQALGSTAEWEKISDEWYQTKLKEVGNQYEHDVLKSIFNRRNSATLDTLSRFETQEKERYFDENTTLRMKSAIDDGLANYADTSLVEQAYNSGLAAIKTNYAGRGEILDSKIKEYGEQFYNAQTMKRADMDAEEAAIYFEQHKDKFSETAKMSVASTLQNRKIAQEVRFKKEANKEAMLCVAGDMENCNKLLVKVQTEQMSLAEIEAAMPKTAGTSFKNLIYRRQGYQTGATKLDDIQQLELKQKIYENISSVVSNKASTIENFKEMQDLIYEGIDKKALSESEGTSLLNNVSSPLMQKWQEKIDSYSDNAWLEPDLGVKGIDVWLEKNYLVSSKAIKAESKERQKVMNAANSRIKTEAYQLYYDKLQDIVKETPELKSIADVLKLKNSEQRSVYMEAQKRVERDFATQRYKSLRNISVNPTYILSNRDGMVQISSQQEEKPIGKPLMENRVVKPAFDKSSGKYGLQMADGTTKEVSREVYKSYGGKN